MADSSIKSTEATKIILKIRDTTDGALTEKRQLHALVLVVILI